MSNNRVSKQADFLFYDTPDGKLHMEVFYAGETVWLTQDKMTQLFDVDRTVISKHISNIFSSGELEESSSNVQKMHVAHSTKPVSYYSLDVIISVGYRVNSFQATQFRKWATTVLRDYMVKGFALDDERLKNGTHFGKDYFEEHSARDAACSRATSPWTRAAPRMAWCGTPSSA